MASTRPAVCAVALRFDVGGVRMGTYVYAQFVGGGHRVLEGREGGLERDHACVARIIYLRGTPRRRHAKRDRNQENREDHEPVVPPMNQTRTYRRN